MDDYRHPIDFLRVENTTDAMGNLESGCVLHHHCRARVNRTGGNETFSAASDRQEDVLTFAVRWCPKADMVQTAGFVIRFRGRLYDIQQIDNFKFTDRELKFKAVSRV